MMVVLVVEFKTRLMLGTNVSSDCMSLYKKSTKKPLAFFFPSNIPARLTSASLNASPKEISMGTTEAPGILATSPLKPANQP